MRHQAIILKKVPIREYDELLVCYTRDAGKQVYQAKSVLLPISKQAGHLEVLNLVDFSLVHKNSHPIITSAYCLDSFRYLKSSLPAMAVAFFLLECFDKLIFENEPDPGLWDFLLMQLRAINNQPIAKNADSPRAALGFRGRPSVTPATTWSSLISATSSELWRSIIKNARRELLKILGYDPSISVEELANSQFKSLQFTREVLG